MEIEEAIIRELGELGIYSSKSNLYVDTYYSANYWNSDCGYSIIFEYSNVYIRLFRQQDSRPMAIKVFDMADPSFKVNDIADFINCGIGDAKNW